MAEPYWAAREGDLLATAMLEKVKIFTQRFIGSRDLERLEAAARQYYGTDENGDFAWKVERKGSKKQIRALKSNEFRQNIRRKLAIVTGNPGSFMPVPVNTDEQTLNQSLLARAVLNYYFEDLAVEEDCDYAAEIREVLGHCWVDVPWDFTKGETLEALPGVPKMPRMDTMGQNVTGTAPELKTGDVDVVVYLPSDVIREYESRRAKDAWVILRSWHNRYDVAAQMEAEAQAQNLQGEELEKALSLADQVRGLSAASNTDDEQLIRALRLQLGQVQPIDEVPVLDLRHLPCPALPQGRRARLVGTSILLESGPLPYEDLGCYETRAGRRFGTTRSYTGSHDQLGRQRAIDALTSIPYSNQAALGLNVLVSGAGSDLKLEKLREGLVNVTTKRPDQPPAVLQLCRTPPEVFPFRKDLISEQGLGMGLTAQSQGMGSKDASGARAALDDTQTQRNMSADGKAQTKLRKDVANAIIRRLKKFGGKTRKLPLILGKSKVPKMQDFTGTTDLAQIDRVKVETTGPLGSSMALRQEALKDIMQMEAVAGQPVLNPEQYITFMNTGTYEPMTEAPQQEMQLIRAENEQIAAGVMLDDLDPNTGQPIPGGKVTALWSENPARHMREHDTVMSTLEAKNNPAVKAAWTAHQMAHQAFLLEWYSGSPRMLAKHGPPKDPYTGEPIIMPAPPPSPGGPQPGGAAPPQAQDKPPALPSLPSNPATGDKYTPNGAMNG